MRSDKLREDWTYWLESDSAVTRLCHVHFARNHCSRVDFGVARIRHFDIKQATITQNYKFNTVMTRSTKAIYRMN